MFVDLGWVWHFNGFDKNQRFQIRYLENVLQLKEGAKKFQFTRLKKNPQPWQFNNLKALLEK